MKITKDLFEPTISIHGIEIDAETLIRLLWGKIQKDYNVTKEDAKMLDKHFTAIDKYIRDER